MYMNPIRNIMNYKHKIINNNGISKMSDFGWHMNDIPYVKIDTKKWE
jgi:hypothetical protein